ncbi:MAG: DEAD/DEAH box helicase [Bacteroidales bacterium]|nr:DEAD/DEAH box helicase [Bacteroidales bacterium]
MITFSELGLRQELIDAVSNLGFENPMPVQEKVIPFMLSNDRDLVALAQTGTGKTAAFGLPILNMITSENKIQSLILAPTRELCIQISNDLKNYSSLLKNIKIVPVYGGENIVSQFKQLDVQPQVLVATPGRLIDLINREKVKLNEVKYLVLDEADEMLNMGFQEDLETILQFVPSTRRTLLFSATMPEAIAKIAQQYMHDAEEIAVGTRNAGADNVEHVYYMVQAANRYLALKRIVDMNPDIYGIVFCRTRQETKEVAEKLMKDGYNADALHGDLSQAQRDTVMNKFRIKNIQVLVATDVAARGLDVSNLTHVINYNLPDDVEVYTHRSGRTGRAGKKGVSCVIIHSRERNKLRDIEKIIKKEFVRKMVPTGMDVCKRQLFHLIDKMENVQVNNEEIDVFMPQISAKLSYLSKEEIISRFVSLEFNRFVEYYKDSDDINIDLKTEKKEKKKKGKKVRLKILYGFKQNATPRSVLGVINEVTQDKSIMIGDIEITNKFTFFDVFEDQADAVIQAFQNEAGNYKIAIAEKSGNKKSNSENSGTSRGKYYNDRDNYRDRDKDRERSRRGKDKADKSDKKERKSDRKESKSRTFNNYLDEFIDFEKPWRKNRR